MAIIFRIDVDRPYGKQPAVRHVLSRLRSDYYFPKIEWLGYLSELKWMLGALNEHKGRAYVFFRQCTLPSPSVMSLMDQGGHELGLHLENSRSLQSFVEEKEFLENVTGRPIRSFSKHGSNGLKYGARHYGPYEPDKYIQWANQAKMKLFLGNLEDPTLAPTNGAGCKVFPSAFWLEPGWRDTGKFPLDWLIAHAPSQDIVVLMHPENVAESPEIKADFERLLSYPSTILS